ncbi:MAG: DGQHR domain-containing protein [Chloroflexi bacterium]|nr:DGQHR domain-containing protein [Chloroflexota bacterium]MCY3937810.1 DGQHR domain-containing protein [Chloroflexota bacterium]
MALMINQPHELFSLDVASHRFRQGGRDVYYFALDLDTLDGTLPQRVKDDVMKDANRRLTPSHARNIREYLDEQPDWLLGALLLGIDPAAIVFEPYRNERHEVDNPNFGRLRVRTNRMNTMRIFDGQHRRRAIRDLLDELRNDQRSATKLAELRQTSLAIVLYAESDIRTLKQMFVDASQTKRIEQHTVVRFDKRNAFNLAAMELAESSPLLTGRIEFERSSVGVRSPLLLSINQLATILKSLEIGSRGRVSRSRNEEYVATLDALVKSSREWVDEFMPSAREEYDGLLTGEIENREIPELRTRSYAYSVVFIRVLAEAYRLWMQEHNSWKPLAEFMRGTSIDQKKEYGLLIDAGLVNPLRGGLFSRRQEMAAASAYIVKEARESAKYNFPASGDEDDDVAW